MGGYPVISIGALEDPGNDIVADTVRVEVIVLELSDFVSVKPVKAIEGAKPYKTQRILKCVQYDDLRKFGILVKTLYERPSYDTLSTGDPCTKRAAHAEQEKGRKDDTLQERSYREKSIVSYIFSGCFSFMHNI